MSPVRGGICHELKKVVFHALVLCLRGPQILIYSSFILAVIVLVECVCRTAAADTDTADPKLQQHIFPLEKTTVKHIPPHNLHPAAEIARMSFKGFHASMPNTQGLSRRDELRVQPDRRRQAACAVPRARSAARQSQEYGPCPSRTAAADKTDPKL